MNIEQLVAGQSPAEINAMADKLERVADVKAAAAAKAKAKAAGAAAKAKAAGANAAKAKAAANAANAKTVGALKTTAAGAGAAGTSKSTAAMVGACCSSKSWTLGLGLGLGPWGPVLLAAGGAVGGYYVYKNYLKDKLPWGGEIDAPTI
ncbi:hypothetical protein V5T82_16350 [Magnetovibrio sp. PR-2]|uniref:hypothetical protein n=1 Tax=Magnetovibrio sp. PR-2 TaxID=3120356 RepID=UPI002FCE04CC